MLKCAANHIDKRLRSFFNHCVRFWFIPQARIIYALREIGVALYPIYVKWIDFVSDY